MQIFPPFENHFLGSLSAEDRDLLIPLLKTIDLAPGQTLFSTGDTIKFAHFPHSSIVSLMIESSDGRWVETGIVGRNGVVGGGAALGSPIAINRAFVQVPGRAEAVKITDLRRLADQSKTLRLLLLPYEQMALAQAQQMAACNAVHGLEERLSRWLLQYRDLLGSDTLPLTQEFLAIMLGAQRTSVTLIAKRMQKSGLIEYRRGRITVVDVKKLKDATCECYICLNETFEILVGWRPRAVQRSLQAGV